MFLKRLSECTILAVDDTETNIDIIVETLGDDYDLAVAMDGPTALEIAQDSPPDLILLDIMMPEMNGYQVMERLQDDLTTRNIPVIFLTAMSADENETTGLRLGAVDYIRKPFNAEVLKQRVRNHLELSLARKFLKDQNVILDQKVKERTQELENSQRELIYRLMRTTSMRDYYSKMHVHRLRQYIAILARAMTLTETEVETLSIAGTIHDLGKVGIPEHILLKPGKLDENEWAIMKTHCQIGSDCLSGSGSPIVELARTIAYEHHERWDGAGYPQGLAGEDISLSSRIVAVASVFEALTTRRPYREAMKTQEALDVLRDGKGTLFDKRIVETLLQNIDKILASQKTYSDNP